jgi:hypothetical protein
MPETVINIPLRQDESDAMAEAAKRARLSLVQWAKVVLLRAALPPTGKDVPPKGAA